MQTRPATPDDLPAITAVQRAWDTAWFGAPELDLDEVREQVELVPDLGTQSLLVHDGADLVGVLWWWGRETTLFVAPGTGRPRQVADLLLAHAVAAGVRDAHALDRDTVLIDAITALGWGHEYSSFELVRTVMPDWELPEPRWPDGVRVAGFTDGDVAALHRLVYDAARWADVPGHVRREPAEWASLFLTGPVPTSEQVVAWRGDVPVGLALTRTFSDGLGWVNQLAVAADERRHGLGRALLLEGLRRRRDSGAVRLGLGVQAANAGALRLYESVGLHIEREFRSFVAPS